MNIITFKNVWFRYNSHWIIEDANLSIREKDFTCIVGPNGGGKTTFLKLILGLIKPEKGTILVAGKKPEESRSLIGHMPQSLNFDPHFPISVLDVVLMGVTRIGPQEKAEAISLLKELEMADTIKCPFSSLSGGQRQRVLIARALMGKPKILVFDEPTANMDVEVSQKLIDLMKYLNQQMTILMVSHDYRFVEGTVSQVVCVNKTVAVHGTEAITPDRIYNTFHGNIRLIQHNHCLEDGHEHNHNHEDEK